MNELNEAELRRLAEAATGGDWEFRLGLVRTMVDSDGYVPVAIAPNCPKNWRGQRDTNMEYIAAANPATVLSLLDELEYREDKAARTSMAWAQEVTDLRAEAEDLRTKNAGLMAQHARDSATLRELCQARDDSKKERDAALAELEACRKDAEIRRKHDAN